MSAKTTKPEKFTKGMNGHFMRSQAEIDAVRALGYTVVVTRAMLTPSGGFWTKANINGNRLRGICKTLEAASPEKKDPKELTRACSACGERETVCESEDGRGLCELCAGSVS